MPSWKASRRLPSVSAVPRSRPAADALCYGAHITGDLIRPEAYPQFLEAIDRKMEEAIGAPLIFHCCGRTMDRIQYFNANGQTAFHFESQNDPGEMKSRAEMVLVGNINNRGDDPRRHT